MPLVDVDVCVPVKLKRYKKEKPNKKKLSTII